MLKEMLKRCAKTKYISVEYYGDDKFLSDGVCLAYIGGTAPDWTAIDCATALELSDEEKEIYKLLDGPSLPHIQFDETELDKAERMRYSLNMDGNAVQPFRLEGGRVMFVEIDKLRIFKDEGIKQYYFGMFGKRPALYVTTDTRIIGVIPPLMIDADIMEEFTTELFQGAKLNKDKNFCVYGGQMSLLD